MTQSELKQAIQRLIDQGVDPEALKRAARKVKPKPPKRCRGNWALKRESHGTCRSLSTEEIHELGYPVSEEIQS